VREGWDKKKLGEVCVMIKRGIAPRYVENGGLSVLNQKCVRNHEVSFEFGRRHDVQAKSVDPERYIRVGDVLINSTGTGTLGRVAQVRFEPPEPATVDTHVTIARPKLDRFYPDFFGYMLVRIEDEITKSGEGASGQTELSRTVLENKFTPSFPKSIPEQRRIVAILDEAFAGLATATANAQKNIENAKELFYSYLNLVFAVPSEGDGRRSDAEWRRWCIRDVCDSIVDCPNRTAPTLDVPSPYKMIRTTNVRHGRVNLEDVNFVAEETYRRWTRRQVPRRGDVVLTREAPLGEVGILNTDDQVFLGQRLVSYRTNSSKLNSEFLLFSLMSRDLQGQIKRFGSGATVQHMRVPDSKALMLSLPSLSAQQNIVGKLRELREASDQLVGNYKTKLVMVAQLKQSILQKAFSGELTSISASIVNEAAE
jgi:type I restriction enzyme, S subunit